jgi:hypothetical protein
MSRFKEKAEAQTEEIIGRMLGDELLVKEGQERTRKAEIESGPPEDHHVTVARDPSRSGEADQGIVRDERGQEQPRDKARAQQVSRVDKGGDPPGKKV